jgi:enoyl-[acyl-carrier-protein] reductase (NADH)
MNADSKENNMENLKLPVTVIGVVILQIGGFIWWTAQQAATIADLEETVSQLGSRMAIEDNVNLKRDVIDNAMEIDHVWDDVDDLWHEIDGMMMSIGAINGIKQRIAVIENELKYINRDHGSMLDMKGGMK